MFMEFSDDASSECIPWFFCKDFFHVYHCLKNKVNVLWTVSYLGDLLCSGKCSKITNIVTSIIIICYKFKSHDVDGSLMIKVYIYWNFTIY